MPLLHLSGLDALIPFIVFLKVEDYYVGALTGILELHLLYLYSIRTVM